MAQKMTGILSPRLQRLCGDLQSSAGALHDFWGEVERQGSPLIEPGSAGTTLVTFLWRDDGSSANVAVIQDWGADGIREHHMALLPGSDVWYLTRTMRSDTRTTYQLSPSASADPGQPAPYQLDPLNPKTYTAYHSDGGIDILFSSLELPDAPALPWRQTGLVKAGRVELHRPFADQRRVWVYMPPMLVTAPLAALLVFDGQVYKDMLKLPEMLDYLIERGEIQPAAALMIDHPDRSELLCNAEFAGYITNLVLPWFRAAYPITTDAQQTTLVGASYGGLGAAFLAFQNPHIYGSVISQTGWFRWHPDGDDEHHWLARQYAAAPRLPVRFWLQAGNLETAQMLDGGPSQLAANQRFRDTLQAREYSLSYHEYSGGHDASSLEFPLAQALKDRLK